MNDASIRTVHRYMVGINSWSAATGQPVGAVPAEGAAGAASPGSASSGRSATEQALLKVAEAATVKLPTWKSSTAMSVKQIKAHIKSYAAGKRSTWSAGQLDKAVMVMRKNAHRSAAEQRAAARDMLADGEDGTDLDFREAGEFLQSLPGHIKTAAKINQSPWRACDTPTFIESSPSCFPLGAAAEQSPEVTPCHRAQAFTISLTVPDGPLSVVGTTFMTGLALTPLPAPSCARWGGRISHLVRCFGISEARPFQRYVAHHPNHTLKDSMSSILGSRWRSR